MRAFCNFPFLGLTLLLTGTGCSSYEYDIIQPTDLAQHVGCNSDVVITRGSLLYRFRSYESHLVIQIHNPTTQPITLMGGQSFVVDTQGQSHPVQTQTIGPEAYIKLILPPTPPEILAPGPGIGIELGMERIYPYGPGGYAPFDDPFLYTPPYLVAVGSNQESWEWTGQRQVQLGLSFWRGGASFEQGFVFRRRKI